MKPQQPQPARAWSLTKLLLVTSVIGLAVGAALSVRQQREFQRSLEAMERHAETIDFPLPSPVAAAPRAESRPAVDPRLLAALPAFPNARPRDLFQGELIKGAPMSVAWFSTPETVDSVLEYYDEYFKLSGQEHRKHKYGPNSGYVAWFEEDEDLDAGPGEGVMHLISAIRQGDETMVLLSETNPLAVLEGPPQQLPDGVHVPANASRPTVLNLETGLSIHSRLAPARLEDVSAEYLGRLSTTGWQTTPPTVINDTWSVSARRPGQEQVVSLVRRNAGVDIVITSRRTE